jgi:adenylate cyclase
VIGDLINTTARVESLTKHYGVLALATGEVHERFTRPPQSRLIDRVVVKGKRAPLELFELRDKFSPENFHEVATRYAEAFVLYEEGRFDDAARMFRALAEFDKPSRVLAARCAELCAHPPTDWHGTFALSTK